MAKNRLDLQDELEAILGTTNVYYQPPNSTTMVYPCIVYKKEDEQINMASNEKYQKQNVYTVTVISRTPDSIYSERVGDLKYSRFSRHLVSDNLHHDVYTLYY